MNIALDGREATAFHAEMRKHRRRGLLALLGSIALLFCFARAVRAFVKLAAKQPVFTACDEGADCASGRCVVHSGDLLGQCSKSCEADADCGANSRCVPIAHERYCVRASPDGSPCHDAEDCRSGVCATDPGDLFVSRCARGCGDDGAACPEDLYCDRTDIPHTCAPKKPFGLPCGSDDECLAGDCASADVSTMEAALRTRACSNRSSP